MAKAKMDSRKGNEDKQSLLSPLKPTTPREHAQTRQLTCGRRLRGIRHAEKDNGSVGYIHAPISACDMTAAACYVVQG
jgi:hypothetical protein